MSAHPEGCCCDACNPDCHPQDCMECEGYALTAQADHPYMPPRAAIDEED